MAPCISTPSNPAAWALRAACRYSSTIPAISDVSSARGVTKGFIPSTVMAWPAGAIADGATGSAPSGCSDGCEIRPTCQSCRNMRPPCCVHRVGHAFPSGDLFGTVDARRARIAQSLRRDLCRLADDQSGGGALGVIGDVERTGRIAAAGAIARHRRHHDSIGQLRGAEPQRQEDVDVGHCRTILSEDRFVYSADGGR